MATTTTLPTRIGADGLISVATRARWATVLVETDRDAVIGRLYVPESRKRTSDVLCDGRPFLFLAEVQAPDGGAVEPFVAINKAFVRTVRILDEGDGAQAMATATQSGCAAASVRPFVRER